MSSYEISYRSFDFEYDADRGTLLHIFETKDPDTICGPLKQSQVLEEIEKYVTNKLQTLHTDIRSIKNTISYIQNQTVTSDLMSEVVTELEDRLQDLQLQVSDIE